jgi:hypothetical protein
MKQTRFSPEGDLPAPTPAKAKTPRAAGGEDRAKRDRRGFDGCSAATCQ